MAPKTRISRVQPSHKLPVIKINTQKIPVIKTNIQKYTQSVESKYAKPIGPKTLAFIPFEARLPTFNGKSEIDKEKNKLKDGYYRNINIFAPSPK